MKENKRNVIYLCALRPTSMHACMRVCKQTNERCTHAIMLMFYPLGENKRDNFFLSIEMKIFLLVYIFILEQRFEIHAIVNKSRQSVVVVTFLFIIVSSVHERHLRMFSRDDVNDNRGMLSVRTTNSNWSWFFHSIILSWAIRDCIEMQWLINVCNRHIAKREQHDYYKAYRRLYEFQYKQFKEF
jgi:hypothetical protein